MKNYSSIKDILIFLPARVYPTNVLFSLKNASLDQMPNALLNLITDNLMRGRHKWKRN